MIVRSRRVRAAAAALGAVLALTAACSFGPPGPDQQGEPPNLPAPSVAVRGPDPQPTATRGHDHRAGHEVGDPWGIALLPDGTALVTERKRARPEGRPSRTPTG